MPAYLFWIFSALMLAGGAAVVAFRNPVSSALSMVASFVGLAGLFVGLSAFFVGIIQILVYTGAVMVLFIFIIMLLDLKEEKLRTYRLPAVAGGLILVVAFIIQLVAVLGELPHKRAPLLGPAELSAAAEGYTKSSPRIAAALQSGSLPDVNLIGQTLFTQYNLPLQVLGVLLLVATIGVIALSRRQPE
jgi:NADH-quinone oxidoreductase subunit J